MNFERQSNLFPTTTGSRRARPSLLRLSLSRISAQRQQPPRKKRWLRDCLRHALSTRLVLLLLGVLLLRILAHHATAILELVRDPTEPTTFFRSYRIHGKEVVLRSWRKPIIFTPFKDETKRFIRHQPISELQRAPRPSA